MASNYQWRDKWEQSRDPNRFFQRNDNRNDNQQNLGSGNDRPNCQQNNNVITCCAWNQPGHIARNCPLLKRGNNNSQQNDNMQVFSANRGTEGSKGNQEENTENNEGDIFNATQLFQSWCNCDNNFHLQNEGPQLRNKLLLDNQSTTDIFCNPECLTNIHEVKDTLHLQTDGGVLKCNTRGLHAGNGYVWCDTRAIANVISLDNAEKPGKFDTSHEAKQGFVMSN